MRIFRLLSLLLVFSSLGLLAFGASTAKAGGDPFASANNIQDLGPWYSKSATDANATVNVYRPELDPYSQTKNPESLNFACIYPQNFMGTSAYEGRPIDKQTLAMYSDLVSVAREVYIQPDEDHYQGIFSWDAGNDKVKFRDGEVINGVQIDGLNAYPQDQKQITGKINSPEISQSWATNPELAMKAFLTFWHNALTKLPADSNGDYKNFDALQKVDASNSTSTPFTVGDTFSAQAEQDALKNAVATNVTTQEQSGKLVANLIPFFDAGATKDSGITGAPVGEATTNPQLLTSLVPFSCNLSITVNLVNNSGGITGIVKHTGDFITNMFFDMFDKTVGSLYGVVSPLAFKWAFWTPHTERGDTIFDANFDCTKNSKDTNWCNTAKGTSNGFSVSNRNPVNQKVSKAPIWVRYSIIAQWLVSGLYFIILFGGAVIYMFRGHKLTAYNVIHMLPRLLLSVMLTAFSSYLIGMLITISNDLVVSLFQNQAATNSIRSLNDLASSTSALTGASLVGRVVGAIVTVFALWFLTWILLLSLARQLLLAVLVMLAPIALFCLIVPRWQHRFKQFFRLILAVLLVPPIIALILRVGVAINPSINSSSTYQGHLSLGRALLGGMVGIMTFWAMSRVMRVWFAVIKGHSWSEGMSGSGAMGMLGAYMANNTKAGGLGRALMRGSQISDTLGEQSARLIPRSKESAPGTAGNISARQRHRYQSGGIQKPGMLKAQALKLESGVQRAHSQVDKMAEAYDEKLTGRGRRMRKSGTQHAIASAKVGDPVGVAGGGAKATAGAIAQGVSAGTFGWMLNAASGGLGAAANSRQLMSKRYTDYRNNFPNGPSPQGGFAGMIPGAVYQGITPQETQNFKKQRDEFWQRERSVFEDDKTGEKRLDKKEYDVFHDLKNLKGVMQIDPQTGLGMLLKPNKAINPQQVEKMQQTFMDQREHIMRGAVAAVQGVPLDSASARNIIEDQIHNGWEKGRNHASSQPLESAAHLDKLLWDIRGNQGRKEELVMEVFTRALAANQAGNSAPGTRSAPAPSGAPNVAPIQP
jgi:hypothetical protein